MVDCLGFKLTFSYQKVAGIALNGQTKRTNKIKHTANPIFNSSLQLRLTGYSINGPILHIAVFDKHRKYSIYLGELRLSVVDIFEDSDKGLTKTIVAPKWYKLHSSKSQDTFVTGSIKVGFELKAKTDVVTNFKIWQSSLINREKSIKINDQDYYSDTETDVESLMLEEPQDGIDGSLKDLDLSTDSVGLPKLSTSALSQSSIYLQPPSANGSNSNYESSYYSSDVSDTQFLNNVKTLTSSSRRPHIRKPVTIAGVVFLEIISADNLPPFKRFIQKGFDMDPFVVISFGKKTYRTSWRKHTLTPVFNQTLAFEVLSNEINYDLVFNILDKDHISFHDKVAFGSISLHDIIDEQEFVDYDLNLKLFKENLDYEPSLKFRIRFKPYSNLKQALWESVLLKYGETLDIIQLDMFLEYLNINAELASFYKHNDKSMGDLLSISEIVKVLELHNVEIKRCPLCGKRKQMNMVTHVAICSAKGDKLKSYATAGFASKRWYSKVLIKFAYGKYALGKNNANILVQDRLTGFIIEEKMALYVRLGIRLLYKGKGADSKRIKNLLKSLSVKQGARFDSVASVKDIDSFIKFHQLDLSECQEVEYKTFNEFFYRKLKPGSRVPESPNSKIITSPADSRATTFNDISLATKIWIKSRSFSIQKLLGDEYSRGDYDECSIAVFRLAPQDYHRFHSPVDGIIQAPIFIQGEYYTVNPMAIRSDLDVFGENIRVVIPIETEHFGRVLVIAVGAMMVGSTVLTVSKGDAVKRADELGYFKFGGSTVLVLFERGKIEFDSDLVANSLDCTETLVRVGMSVGHAHDVEEFERKRINFEENSEEEKLKIIRTITGGNAEHPWEYFNMNIQSDDELDEEDEDL